jgi:hypothetical protein
MNVTFKLCFIKIMEAWVYHFRNLIFEGGGVKGIAQTLFSERVAKSNDQ